MSQPISSSQSTQLELLPQYTEGNSSTNSQPTQSTLSSQSEDLGYTGLFQSIGNSFTWILETLLSYFYGCFTSSEVSEIPPIPLLPANASYIDQKTNASLRDMINTQLSDAHATSYLHEVALELHEIHQALMRHETSPAAVHCFFQLNDIDLDNLHSFRGLKAYVDNIDETLSESVKHEINFYKTLKWEAKKWLEIKIESLEAAPHESSPPQSRETVIPVVEQGDHLDIRINQLLREFDQVLPHDDEDLARKARVEAQHLFAIHTHLIHADHTTIDFDTLRNSIFYSTEATNFDQDLGQLHSIWKKEYSTLHKAIVERLDYKLESIRLSQPAEPTPNPQNEGE